MSGLCLNKKVAAMLRCIVVICRGTCCFISYVTTAWKGRKLALCSLFLHSLDIAHRHSMLKCFVRVWASICTRLVFHAAEACMHDDGDVT